ncbi:hypothetical protein NQD34_000023 [Periophthalmus magnuspinnatus]|nr:hypothetical protein NQD34_000023 [Periophthalmus magnuspinnatus]
MDRYSDRITADAEQDPEILELLHLGQRLSTRREQTTFFRWRTMASDLEELILIQTLHTRLKPPQSCRSWLEEASGQHHPQTAEMKSCVSQTRPPPAPEPDPLRGCA